MNEIEEELAQAFALEFVRTGVLDCRRLARLAYKIMNKAKKKKPK